MTNDKIFCIIALPISFFLNLRLLLIFCRKLMKKVVCSFNIFWRKIICFTGWYIFYLSLLFQIILFYDVLGWLIFNYWRSYLVWSSKKCWSCHVLYIFFLFLLMIFHIVSMINVKLWTWNTLIQYFFLVIIFIRLLHHWIMLVWRWKSASWVIFRRQILFF